MVDGIVYKKDKVGNTDIEAFNSESIFADYCKIYDFLV